MARPTKHYGGWRIRWFDADGERRSETFEKKADAEFKLRQYETESEEIRRGLRPRPISSHSFAELADYWLEHRAPAKRSRKDDESIIRRHLRPALGALALRDVSVERVDVWRDGLEVSPKTEHNVLTLLISVLNLGVELGWLDKCPPIRKPKITINGHDYRYLRTEEEIARFLNAAMDHGEVTVALYATAVYTGMRAGELAALRWEDVDLDRRLITVQRSFCGPTKSGDLRHVPILDPLLPVLRQWRLRWPGPIVFPSTAGTMYQPSARIFQETLHEVLAAAKLAPIEREGKLLPYITFHGLRHTFASHWMMKGGSIFKLQRIGGWKSFALVQRYAHLAPDAFAGDYGLLGSRSPIESGAAVIPMPASSQARVP